MTHIKKRRFINIMRLGNIPGLTTKTTQLLRRKKSRKFLRPKKFKRRKKNFLNFSIIKKSYRFKYKRLFNTAYYANIYLYKEQLKKVLKNKQKKRKKIPNFYKFYIYQNLLNFNNILNGNGTYLLLKYSKYLYQFKERQKIKLHHQLKDYQLEKIAKKCINNKDDLLLQKKLNSRLDTIIFNNNKSVKSMKHAKQLITHKKVKINNKTINKPSYICKEKDKIYCKLNNNKTLYFKYSINKTNKSKGKQLIFSNYTTLLEYYLKKI
uniref:ribosomal protein S4 n=1 Tax=Prototheca vistulensis TaxID=2689584 RepID=UPI00300390FE